MSKHALPTSEQAEQVLVRQWRDLMMSEIPVLRWLVAIPNGGMRHKRIAAQLKAEGVVAGVSDLILIHRQRGYNGLAIEMKKEGGRLTPDQKEFLAHAASENFFAVCAFSGNVAIDILEWYIGRQNSLPQSGKFIVFSDLPD